MTTNLKLQASFADPAQSASAEIITLRPATRISNDELRQRQYLIQKAMYDAARDAANECLISDETLRAVRHQPVRAISATQAQQAAIQGERGFAFKL